jgi:5-deoxy-glucuronate isomerase
MYYFTILAGETQRPLHMNFHKDHAYQLDIIPGMQDMLGKFK